MASYLDKDTQVQVHHIRVQFTTEELYVHVGNTHLYIYTCTHVHIRGLYKCVVTTCIESYSSVHCTTCNHKCSVYCGGVCDHFIKTTTMVQNTASSSIHVLVHVYSKPGKTITSIVTVINDVQKKPFYEELQCT